MSTIDWSNFEEGSVSSVRSTKQDSNVRKIHNDPVHLKISIVGDDEVRKEMMWKVILAVWNSRRLQYGAVFKETFDDVISLLPQIEFGQKFEDTPDGREFLHKLSTLAS